MYETSCMRIPYVILHDKRWKFAAMQNHELEEVIQKFFKLLRAHGLLERTPHKWYSCAQIVLLLPQNPAIPHPFVHASIGQKWGGGLYA